MTPREIGERIRAAAASGSPLRLRGGGTKDFYGGALRGQILAVHGHAGIVAYEPSELVVTARAGTPLAELERTLEARGQMLAFEPPHFGDGATLGGCVASGLSGPRRASAGALRDFVLGVRMVDGRGHELAFGGRVMKNVAGYDVSRFLAGSLGTLGVLLEVSLKVLPLPACEHSIRLPLGEADALSRFNRWAGQPLPVSATAWRDGTASVRLSGTRSAVRAAIAHIGGMQIPDEAAGAYWDGLREHSDEFFSGEGPLWRLSLPSGAPPLGLDGQQLIEWGGALRWWRSGEPAARVRAVAADAGGHATLFRAADKSSGAFTAPAPALMGLHRRLKAVFDPAGILGPGRLYPEF